MLVKKTIRIPSELIEAANVRRKEVTQTFNSFIVEALAARVRNWKSATTGAAPKATYPSGYPKGALCFHCKEACHDPAEWHGYTVLAEQDLEFAATHTNCRKK